MSGPARPVLPDAREEGTAAGTEADAAWPARLVADPGESRSVEHEEPAASSRRRGWDSSCWAWALAEELGCERAGGALHSWRWGECCRVGAGGVIAQLEVWGMLRRGFPEGREEEGGAGTGGGWLGGGVAYSKGWGTEVGAGGVS